MTPTPEFMIGLAVVVLIGRMVGLLKWETWLLLPALLGCAFWLSVSV